MVENIKLKTLGGEDEWREGERDCYIITSKNRQEKSETELYKNMWYEKYDTDQILDNEIGLKLDKSELL